ncbi:MAG TPA: type III restriction endonuclease subunit R, partial [Agitococcus sp.]|nr:type III restriction endonuclease subunit R [Agitococcus sp.]
LTIEQLEEIKLKDGIRLHEHTKVHLINYAQTTGQKLVKPFVLIIARDTTHAAQLKAKIQSDDFFNGQYQDKVIQVDSSTKEEEVTQSLLTVEDANNPTEIVIHVNMLKEGWDVTNLYTIIPLRAANARTLIEQSIGRGLRLPYGKRTHVDEVDRLSIVAHDRFQEILDEANRSDSVIRLKSVILEAEDTNAPIVSLKSETKLNQLLGQRSPQANQPIDSQATINATAPTPIAPQLSQIVDVSSPSIQQVIQTVQTEIQRYAAKPQLVKHSQDLSTPKIQQDMMERVQQSLKTQVVMQPTLAGLTTSEPLAEVKLAKIVEEVTRLYINNTIDIPRIVVTPSDDVQTGFNAFTLNTQGLRLQPNDRELMGQNLRNHQLFSIKAQELAQEKTPDDLQYDFEHTI